MHFSDNLTIDETTLPIISQLAERIPGGFFIYHADGNQELIYFNSHLPKIFGCDDSDEFKKLVDNSFKGIVHPEDYSRNENEILAQIKESAAKLDHVRYRFIRKDGSVGMMDDYGHFSHSETFGDIYYVFVQDITEQYREEREHKENIARIMALADNFGSLYDVDLATGSYVVYANNHLLSDEQLSTMVNYGDFFADTIKNAELVIFPEDREGLIRVLDRDFVLNTLKTENYFDWYYRLLMENGSTKWARLRFVYKDSSKTHLIVGAFNAEAEMEAKQKGEQLQKELISTFTGSYATVILGNLNDASYSVISGRAFLNGFFLGKETMPETFRRYINEAIYLPDREALEKKLFSSGNIKDAFAVGEVFTYEYRRVFPDRKIWYRMTINRINENMVLMGFEDCDQEHLNAQINDKLLSDFDGIYVIDLDRGKLRPIRISSASKITFEKEIDYTQAVRDFAKTVAPKYKQDWLNFSDTEFMRQYMANSAHREYVYELPGAAKTMRRFSIDILEHNAKGEPSVLLHSFAGIDDDRAAVIRLNRQLADHRKLLEYFVDQYWSACFIDLTNDTLEIIRANNANTSAYIMDGTHADMEKFIDTHFHPDDIPLMRKITDKNFVRKELKDKTSISYTAREIINGEERTMRILIVRGADEDHVAVGFMDITEELAEQKKHLLGAIPLSNNLLTKSNIGLWAFELDEGAPPRMYVDEAMLGLLGLEHQVTPEETYHAWYDHIDKDSYGLVHDAVEKMGSGGHAEVQYPWHHPDGHTMIVRCGGVPNPEYKRGIRIEGTHQDVTQTLHFDEKVARRHQLELAAFRTRAEMLTFISDHEPDVEKFMNYFGRKVMEVMGCDQVIFRDMDGHRIVIAAEGIKDVPQTICEECPFSKFQDGEYGDAGLVQMSNCAEGFNGVMPHHDCPAKSSFMQRVYSDDKLIGLLTVHYLKGKHDFSENDIDIMKTVGQHLGLLLMRIAIKKSDMEKLQAESSSAAKTQFLFNMSHDIRTPMNAILGYTDLALRHRGEEERVDDCLAKIKASGGHLLNLINDILEMSRIEAGTLEFTYEPVDVRKASLSIEAMSRVLAAPKNIDFEVVMGEIRNPYIYADELHVNEVLINIISNAIKYSDENGKVRYSVEQIGDAVDGVARYRFEIADNGIGMSEEFQQHLFETFSREKSEKVAKREGTGIGLSIVKRIVDLAGGTIEVRSKLDVGSTFVVVLPFKVMDSQAIETFQNGLTMPQEETIDVLSLRGKKVLLVEDNELNREIAGELLCEEGLVVEEANDGSKAVELLRKNGPDYYDFILMDIQMPVMNGYEATKAIRAMYPKARIPIIALSANAFAEDKTASLAAGMNDHVAKPIMVKELFAALAKFL